MLIFPVKTLCMTPVASFTKEVNLWLAKHPLKTNGRLANRELTSLIKETTDSLKASAASMELLVSTL